MAQQNGNEILKAREVAKRLGVTSRTVNNWASEGRIPVFAQVGWTRRFNWPDVAAVAGVSAGANEAASHA